MLARPPPRIIRGGARGALCPRRGDSPVESRPNPLPLWGSHTIREDLLSLRAAKPFSLLSGHLAKRPSRYVRQSLKRDSRRNPDPLSPLRFSLRSKLTFDSGPRSSFLSVTISQAHQHLAVHQRSRSFSGSTFERPSSQTHSPASRKSPSRSKLLLVPRTVRFCVAEACANPHRHGWSPVPGPPRLSSTCASENGHALSTSASEANQFPILFSRVRKRCRGVKKPSAKIIPKARKQDRNPP